MTSHGPWRFWAASSPQQPPTPPVWLAALLLVAVFFSHPLSWDRQIPAAWMPPAGFSLLLVAWFGPAAAGACAAVVLLVNLLAGWWDRVPAEAIGWWPGVYSWWDAALAGLEALLGWRLYHRLGHGSARLADPNSAILFLLLVPGAVSGLGALLRLIPFLMARPGEFGPALTVLWAARALGILTIAPPFLVSVTPWLVARGYLPPERPGEQHSRNLTPHRTWGDWLEVAGLAAGTAGLSLLLAAGRNNGEAPWQLWVLPLLLLVWTSLRQGIEGGTLVAAVSVTAALLALSLLPVDRSPIHPLQGYLLSQCSTALLVGVSFSWIRDREARYRQVVGQIPVVLYSARLGQAQGNPTGPQSIDVVFVSPASQQLLHCAPEELLGSHDAWMRCVHPQDRELLQASILQVCRHRQPVTCEYRLADSVPASKAGSLLTTRWLRDSLVPAFGANGQVTGWEGVVEDITEQRVLAQDLRRTTNMLHALVTNLPAGVFFVHAPSGQLILVNSRARKLLGQREDLSAGLAQWPVVYRLHRPDGSLYPAEELPVLLALRRGTTAMCDDIVVHRPDGKKIPLVTWAAPIDLAGEGTAEAAVWVFEDLTSLRRIERDLERGRATERANRSPGGNAEHLNNLLTVVLTSVRHVATRLADNPEVLTELRRIEDAAEQARRLSGQLPINDKPRL